MRHQVCHAHCPKGSGSGIGLVLVAIVAIVAAYHAIAPFLHDVLILALSVVGLAVIVGLGAVVMLAHRQGIRHYQSAAKLPDGTAYPDPVLAAQGWQVESGAYVRRQLPQPATEYHLHLHGPDAIPAVFTPAEVIPARKAVSR